MVLSRSIRTKYIIVKEIIGVIKISQKTVCGSELTENSVPTLFEDNELYFCENECLEEFNTNPRKFINSDHFLIELKIMQNPDS